MDNPGASRIAQWTTPECPFTIEYDLELLDDIRLSVVDASVSMPRGGVEIGGILLGRYEHGRVSILSSAPLECEHATGPSFVLSESDFAKLQQQLADLTQAGNLWPVGWYRSLSRGEIFLSESDLEIYRRFFGEQWQVTLVIKPHELEPVRAGFFFRQANGEIHASVSYREFVLDPLPVHPIPAAQPARRSASPRLTPDEESGPVLDTTLVDGTVFETERPVESTSFSFVEKPIAEPQTPQTREAHPQSWPALAVAFAGLVLGAGSFVLYQKRAAHLPPSRGTPAAVTAAPAARAAVRLDAIDSAGQLQIRWDRDAPSVRDGDAAILTIIDGNRPQTIQLDAEHLRAGGFTYGRQTGRIDVALTIHLPDAGEIREVTSFLGPPPPSVPTAGNKEVRKPPVQPEKGPEQTRREMMRRRMEAQIPDADRK